ncbi:verprolin-like [Copidosoma floridanum]|uniref:verprolin-like n=1 Tax=Copidosoma floridanum TaxID=29053 RepID=UPI0006C94DD4|nr:verprolin-like [Copidosoma floridanum]XP_014214228.1 verprolin-like [Copidosoma floridanum]XP_014214229.1 verprolin-like [Copidosoma floridanum]XP_014214230.1 verprolin-like [Copidosoma floridanum]XP_014214231.1 verprolin-like [Copidosoma floridanum]
MPAPPPPPAPTFNLGAGSPEQDRGALLQSIRAGKQLKKTVTVDKSGPAIAGKVKGESTSTLSTTNVNTRSNVASNKGNSINNGNSMGLGGLFAGGMPKLKPTGMRNNLAERDNGNGPVNMGSATLPSAKRGPPPMPPSAAQKPQIFAQKVTESSANYSPETPKISFGKPTLAPKPPTTSLSGVQQKPSPPPKKLNLTISNSVSRAQSMRIPRSPPVLAPTPSSLHQSQDCLNEPQHRPMITRVLRPPQARPPSPPTSRAPSNSSSGSGTTSNGVPITRVAPPPPTRAPSMPPPPPPLPYRTSSTVMPSGGSTPIMTMATTIRQAPPAPPPPTPPTRSQSLQQRNGLGHTDLELRFAEMFHSIATFPAPAPFRGIPKVYNSKTAAAQKQQAPAPPQRSVSSVGSIVLHSPGSRKQPPQPPAPAASQQWQQQNAASSAC